MSGFSTEVRHPHGRDVAVEKLRGFLDQVRQTHPREISDLEGEWNLNVLTYEFMTFGIKVDGRLTVEDQLVLVEGTLPVAARMFQGKISESLQMALEKTIAA